MTSADLGTWAPCPLEVVIELFAAAPFRWWIGGGLALELHVQRGWREHHDVDVGVARRDLPALGTHLAGWDLQVASRGTLTPWRGEPLDAERHQNNIWCRRAPSGPWELDVTVGDGSALRWIYRRDPCVQVPWETAVRRTADGVPYLAPQLQLLSKSTTRRPKDDLDAAEVIPLLDEPEREFLASVLPSGHPWQRLLA